MEKRNQISWGVEFAHLRSKSEYMNNHKKTQLEMIAEEEEWCSSENKSMILRRSTPKKQFMKRHCRLYNQPPKLSDDPMIAAYQEFFVKLQKHLKVYEYFIESSASQKILKLSSCGPAEYYYKHIHFSNNSRFNQKTSFDKAEEPDSTSLSDMYSSYANSYTSETHLVYNNNRSKIMQFFNASKIAAKSIESKTPESRRRKKITAKRVVLDRTRPKLINLFLKICNTPQLSLKTCRVTNAQFKYYLQNFFPVEMAETLSKYFDFKSANLEDFCTEMDRFILAPEEKLLSMCFDAFDFNKDRYICYQDAFYAIQNRTSDIYDSDLVKIRDMMEMKKKGVSPLNRRASRKGRRMSVMSITSEISVFEEKTKRKEIPYIHPQKPEAITIDDFNKIEFKGKPQLIYYFFKYTCNYNINKCHEITTPAIKSRRQSEDMVVELSQSETNSKEAVDDGQLQYYKDLEISMGLFKLSMTMDLLKKYEILRDKGSLEIRHISKESMRENWPLLFGVKSDYVSERFFSFFAGRKNKTVTKSRFLKKIHSVIEDEYKIKKFSFNIYDFRRDGRITCDEINKMEENLPEHSPVHLEASL